MNTLHLWKKLCIGLKREDAFPETVIMWDNLKHISKLLSSNTKDTAFLKMKRTWKICFSCHLMKCLTEHKTPENFGFDVLGGHSPWFLLLWLLQDRVNYEHSPNVKSQIGPSGSISTWSSNFPLRIKKRRKIKTTYWVDLLIHLRSGGWSQNAVYSENIWEIYLQSQLWSKSYSQYSDKLSDLRGSQDTPHSTLLNESHWFRVFKIIT